MLWTRPAVALLPLVLPTALAVDTVVELGYQTYEGVSGDNGISQWLGMRFASIPDRFSAPEDPEYFQGETAPADVRGPVCIATDAEVDDSMSEDCLFMNVFAPTDADSSSNLPVFVFIQGGGFASNASPDLDGTGLIEASDMGIIVVTFNYRVGLYGFLAGEEIGAAGSYNNGLKDQRKALEWVQNYISQFGGDPDHVVVGGASAGGASVTLLLTAYNGRDDGLFHATAAESQSFPAMFTSEESQFMLDNLATRTECNYNEGNETLSCLRGLDVETLQANGYNSPLPGAENPPIYMYGPTIDGDIVPDYTLRLFEEGKFVKVPTIFGSVSNEGTVFAPRETETIEECDTFLHDTWPSLTPENLERIHSLYPANETETFPDSGSLWRLISDIYGDIRYACPGTFISSMYTDYGVSNAWNYRYAVEDPADMESGLGVPHVVETNAIWGPDYTGGGAPDSYYEENAPIVPIMQAYWTSFIRTFDPNTYRDEASVEWDSWDSNTRIFIKTDDIHMEELSESQNAKCDYLGDISIDIGQ